MPGLDFLPILVLAAVAWLWLDSLKARDAAMNTARAACDSEGLLLLDDTVAICRVALARDDDGHVRVRRVYEFEYSDTGDNRRKGSVVLLGKRVLMFTLRGE
jgi:hypothetical protein